jgi:ADP-ribose pyrophosphatase
MTKRVDDVRKIDERTLFKTKRFAVLDAKLRIRNKVVTKPYISHNDCAEILAVTKSGSIVLIKSYRPEFDGYSYELPSGTLRNREKPERAAMRELEEETGYVGRKIKYMFRGYPLLGYSNCKLHFFLVTGLEKREQHLEDDESIFAKEFRPKEILKMLEDGKIKDLCVLSAMHYYCCVLNKKSE